MDTIIIWLLVVVAALAVVAIVAARSRAARRPGEPTHLTTADIERPGTPTQRVQRHIRSQGGRS